MTRAKDELVLTSAADYGTARARKVSRFVVEALDLPSPAPPPRKSRALEALARHQPAPDPEAARRIRRCPTSEVAAPCRSGRSTTTGPARSSTSTSTGCACRSSSTTASSTAAPCTRRCRSTSARGWRPAVRRGRPGRRLPRGLGVGGLPLPRARGAAAARGGGGAAPLPPRGGGAPLAPTGVEQEFAFYRRPRRGSRAATTSWSSEDGRSPSWTSRPAPWTTRARPQQRAKESLQLDIYALAHLRTAGRLPDRVELRFLESGLAGGKRPTLEDAAGRRR